MPGPERYFRTLSRVRYDWLIERPLAWDECARMMRSTDQCLAIVNTKRDAIALLDALADSEALHLPTLLCGAHRRAVISSVHDRLASGATCRLVSTQVIEAGVDLDFPLVMRAMAPLDSIIQAAGRCNREGRLLEKGRVIIFTPQTGGFPPGFYKTATGVTSAILREHGKSVLDANDPALATAYFKRLFDTLGDNGTDGKSIQALRLSFDYPEVSARFRMIDDDTQSVVVPYGSIKEQQRTRQVMGRLRAGTPEGRFLVRQIQPYLVPVRTYAANGFRARGLIVEITSGIAEWLGGYDSIRGLTADDLTLTELVV